MSNETARILKACGYPTDILVVDFETYYDEDYHLGRSESSLSTVEYVNDERFEVLGVAVKVGDEPAQFLTDHEFRNLLVKRDLRNTTLVMHNARFDAYVLARHYDCDSPFIVDTLDLSRHWEARRAHKLAELAKDFGLGEKGETKVLKGVTFRSRWYVPKKDEPPQRRPRMTDARWAEIAEYATADADLTRGLLDCLLPTVSRPKVELEVAAHTRRLFTHPRLQVDAARGRDLAARMQGEIDAAMKKASDATGKTLKPEDLRGVMAFETLLWDALERAGDTPKKYMKLTARKRKAENWRVRGYEFAVAKDDPEKQLLLNHVDPAVSSLMGAKEAIASWTNHISRVERILRQGSADPRGFPVPLNYHGAKTGRWSGGERVNLQNLGARGHPLISEVRNLFVAPAGYALVIADASQIEARTLAWLAGEEKLVRKFALGEDVYCQFAEKVLGKRVRKPDPHGVYPEVEAWMKWARNSIGKVGILGSGFGLGPARAVDQADGKLSAGEAEDLIATYRAEHPFIVRFWRALEKAFRLAATEKRRSRVGKLVVKPMGKGVTIVLPSGRQLYYHRVRAKGGDIEVYNPLKGSAPWERIWGGYLTENVVQATARDILWEAIHGMEAAGYPVVLHVHDEIVACVPEDQMRDALDTAIRQLSRTPDWATGCPVSAEGVIASRYGTH